MGINQVAFELLIENPMTGYMNEIIFSRILGNDDIEQGAFWCDTTICYICARWQKQVISVDPRVDNPKWANKIKMINRVESTVDKLSTEAIEAERAKIVAEREAEKQAKLKGVTFGSGSETSHRRAASFRKSVGRMSSMQRSGSLLMVDEEKADKLASTAKNLNLTAVGQKTTEAKFGGTAGMTPRKKTFERKLTMLDENAEESVRAPLASNVDQGAFTEALNQAAPGEKPNLERTDTPDADVEKPRK